jgi:hypothetical protein
MNKITHERILSKTSALPVQARLGRSLLEAIDGWRRRQVDIPSRPEALRRLCSYALSASVKPRQHASNRPRKYG